MAKRSFSPGGALSAFGTIRNFMNVVREMSFDDERRQAERLPHFLVVASDRDTGQRIGDELTGSPTSPAVTVWTVDGIGKSADAYDVIVVHDPASRETYRRLRDKLGADAARVVELQSLGGSWPANLRERICNAQPQLAPALGRWFPEFRPAATSAVINETARVNAQFAAVSNLPTLIPIIGSLAAAGADFFVLTKNQVMMVFKLAAINGRDLRDQWRIVREMVPVVGAGFLWRTLAREAADFLPFLIGAVPKVAIAYTGTVAAGRGADFYFRYGKKPSRDQLQGFYAQAAESFKKLPLPTIPGRADDRQSAPPAEDHPPAANDGSTV